MGSKKKKRRVKRRKRSKSSSKTVSESSSRSRSRSHSPSKSRSISPSKTQSDKKRSLKPTDPNEPKKSMTAYMLYKTEMIPKYDDKTQKQTTKIIAEKWRTMSHFQRQPYKQKAKELKNEYMLKLAEYQSSKSYKKYAKKLKKWEKTQTKSQKKTSTKKKKKRGKKRKRREIIENHLSDSPLSSELSDNEPQRRPIKKRKTMNHSSDDSSSDLSDDLDDIGLEKADPNKKRTELSLRDVILDTKFGIPMPSTLRAMKKEEEQETLDEIARAHGLTLSEKFCYFAYCLLYVELYSYNSTNTHENDPNHNKNIEEALKCRICDKVFTNLLELQRHEKQLHTKQCQQCRLKFCTETEREDHFHQKHDIFGENAQNIMDECNRMRVDENGKIIMNKSLSTQRFIHGQSKWRQNQRMRQQMSQIEESLVIDDKKGKVQFDGDKLRKKGPINCASFHKKKRSNMGDTKSWKKEETERFYAILKYTGINFTFMEVLYNKAVTKQEAKKMKKEEEETKKKEKEENDSDVDVEIVDKDGQNAEAKKEKKSVEKVWRYRDAKALKKKWQKEKRSAAGRKKLERVLNKVTFNLKCVMKIAEMAKKNEFVLKDEDYFKDTDAEESEEEEMNGKKMNDEEVEEDEFDPLSEYKDVIEKDKVDRKAIKREEMEKLEAWRKQKENERKIAFMKFKQEEEEWKKYKKEKESSQRAKSVSQTPQRVEGVNYDSMPILSAGTQRSTQTPQSTQNNSQQNTPQNTQRSIQQSTRQSVEKINENAKSAQESDEEDEEAAFNPFDGLDEEEDSDEDIDMNVRDVNAKQGQSNDYDDFDGYESFGDGDEMVDFDADPFE